MALMDKVKDERVYLWYASEAAKNGWSRNVLVHQIESGLYERQAIAEKVNNFESRLAPAQSELASQMMKDPYIFDFIPFKPEYAGQLNFYLSAVDGILKTEQDNPSIGLPLCKTKNNIVAEYSLKDISKPIGVKRRKSVEKFR